MTVLTVQSPPVSNFLLLPPSQHPQSDERTQTHCGVSERTARSSNTVVWPFTAPCNLTRYHEQTPSGVVLTHITTLLIFAFSSGAPDNYRVSSLIYKLNNDQTKSVYHKHESQTAQLIPSGCHIRSIQSCRVYWQLSKIQGSTPPPPTG
jgi:hypothetical protein